jgi:hypothetical protein
MRKTVLALAGLGLFFFSMGFAYTFVAPPSDPFANGNRVVYSLAWGAGFVALVLVGHRVSLVGSRWIRIAFACAVGTGFFFFLFTSNYPEDPWASRLLWSSGIVAALVVLEAIGEWIQNRKRPPR